MRATARSILGPAALIRLAVGWAAFVLWPPAKALLGSTPHVSVLIGALGAVVVVIVVCAFGVVHQAEHLARRLGDPYGSLVLTLSIVLIEVILIAAVMLGPGEHHTIARDSVMAVSMIILNGVIGLCLLVGGIVRGPLAHNRAGTSTYLAMLIVLVSLAFGVPAVLGGTLYSPAQAIPVVVLTLALYAFFLYRQLGANAGDFAQPAVVAERASPVLPVQDRAAAALSTARDEILLRLAVLIATAVPIVLLSHEMAALLDDGLGRVGAPVALAGILIAVIVFLPESITAVRAALRGEGQRVVNLCVGALVSTVGLTIPAVLVIGLVTGQPVVLAESPMNLLLLGVSLLLSIATFASRRVTALHGAAHLALFAVYGMTVFW